MEGQGTAGVDSLISDCDLKEEVTDDDTCNMSDEKVTDTTASDKESSRQFCSISSSPVRNARTFQIHPIGLKENNALHHMYDMDYKTFKNNKSDFQPRTKNNAVRKQTNEQLSENTVEMLFIPPESIKGSDKMILRSFRNLSTDNDSSYPADDEHRDHPKKEGGKVKTCFFRSDDVGTEKPVMRSSKSLKTCRTPPCNTSYPKLVR